MSNIVQNGGFNASALGAPGVVVQIIPPAQVLINGIQTGVIGLVGVGSWGPINSQTLVGSAQEATAALGPLMERTYDIGTCINAASLQGASNFIFVRVADGTEEYATADLLDTSEPTPYVGVILTAKYTGIVGNQINATISTGTQYGTFKLTVSLPNQAAEIYDNLTGFSDLVSAVNQGQSTIRPPSRLVIASIYSGIDSVTVGTAGSYTTIPTFSITEGSGAVLAATMKAVTGTVVTAGSGYVPGDTSPLSGGTNTAAAIVTVSTTKLASTVLNSPGIGYAPGDIQTMIGGTFATAATVTCLTTKVVSATVASGGSSGTPGTQTVTGTTGTGTKFQASVTVSGGGAITAVLSISVAGSYTVNPTTPSNEPVTGAGLTGATLNVVIGISTFSITNAGSYTVNASTFTSSSSGSGTGATFQTNLFGANTVTVSTPGAYTVLPSNPVSQASSSGSGTGATFTMAWGLLVITVVDGGTGYSDTSTISITGSGGGAATVNVDLAGVPELDTYTLAGGTDGANVDTADLLGNDGASPRTGMYALRNSNSDVVILVDCTDSDTWTDQVAFGEQEGAYMILVDVAGQTAAQTATTKNNVGLDSYAAKLMLGDWCYWFDTVNNILRVISPQGFVGGLLASVGVQQSSLNQQIEGVVATQSSEASLVYSNADVTFISNNCMDVILTNVPGIPGSNYFATATGQNTSSTLLTDDDNYTRITNFLALSISGTVGRIFVGKPNSIENQKLAATTLNVFLQSLTGPNGIINRATVSLGTSPNPYLLIANVKVYDNFTIRTFLVNLQTGDTNLVSVTPAPQQ